MKLRAFNLNDYEEVVDMYYAFVKEVYGEIREISPKYFYYQAVTNWINSDKHIVLAVKDKTIVGFSMCYIDSFGSLTESVYNCEYAYVKPEYRNTKAGYLLYNNGERVANELKLNLFVSSRIENGTDKMVKKHFNLEEKFINFERRYINE